MPTLQEILEKDMGLGAEKTAAAKPGATAAGGSDEIDKLAAEIGFDFGKDAGADAGTGGAAAADGAGDDAGVKTAAPAGMTDFYNQLFPDDGDLTVKTAEEEKVAYERDLGARAFDHFAEKWDRRIEKIAADVMSGSATVHASTAANPTGAVHQDSHPPQAQATNKPANADKPINTGATSVQDDVKGKNDARTVGHFEQKTAAMSGAMRKHFLLSQLDSAS